MLGNGESAIKTISPASGALYATSNTGTPTFGTLPVAQGGTGVTTAQAERNRLGLGNTTGAIPVANGGTGASNAQQALRNITGLQGIWCGSAIFYLHDAYQVLWNRVEFNRITGHNANDGQYVVLVSNGDWDAVPVTYSTAIQHDQVVVYVHNYDGVKGNARVNYLIAKVA